MAAADPSLSLLAYGDVVAGCERCALAATRTQVVFGSGSPHADLMFVGEAPGFHEDKQGVPFVGAAGKLLSKLLAGIGMTRETVYIANVVKCRPPGNRDPLPAEIESCESHLFKQIELIQPQGRCDARQLRDQAALRQARRHHARPRGAARGRPGRKQGAALPDLPSRRSALHAADARGARSRLSAASQTSSAPRSSIPRRPYRHPRSRPRRRPPKYRPSSASSNPSRPAEPGPAAVSQRPLSRRQTTPRARRRTSRTRGTTPHSRLAQPSQLNTSAGGVARRQTRVSRVRLSFHRGVDAAAADKRSETRPGRRRLGRTGLRRQVLGSDDGVWNESHTLDTVAVLGVASIVRGWTS